MHTKRPFTLSRCARDTGWRHLIVLFAVVFAVFPLLHVLSASLRPAGTLVGSNQLFHTIDFSNYIALFTNPDQPYAHWFINSLAISFITSGMTVFLGAMAAYAFSRMRFRGRRVGLLSLILIQMFPQFLAVVSLFLLLSTIGTVIPALGLGTQLGLIFVYLGRALGVNTYLMYGFFSTVPISIDEAEDRRRKSRADLLHDHPSSRCADPRGRRTSLIYRHDGGVCIGQHHAHRPDHSDARGRPLQLRVAGLLQRLEHLRCRCGLHRRVRDDRVSPAAEIHRRRADFRLGEVGIRRTGESVLRTGRTRPHDEFERQGHTQRRFLAS